MKALRMSINAIGLLLVAVFLSGCATTQPDAAVQRFQEDAAADLVLRFNRWDTIHMIRPDSREGGFLPILTRSDVETELKTQQQRRMAVVVLAYMFSREQEILLAREWERLLEEHGYERVVTLRAGQAKSLDGLIIVRDTRMASVPGPVHPTIPLATLSATTGIAAGR